MIKPVNKVNEASDLCLLLFSFSGIGRHKAVIKEFVNKISKVSFN